MMADAISPEIKTFLISMLPVVGAHGAVPIAIEIYGLHWIIAFILSAAGSIVPVIPLLMALEPLSKFMEKYTFYGKYAAWLNEHKLRKDDIIEKYETLGLMIFVSIPLPVLGVWSASIIAFFLGVKFRHALISIGSGAFISGVISLSLIKAGWFSAIITALVFAGLAGITISKMMFKDIQEENIHGTE